MSYPLTNCTASLLNQASHPLDVWMWMCGYVWSPFFFP